MGKQAFLEQLEKGLSGLPQDDTKERLTFYSEMIDDRMEDGLSEEAAVREVGNVDEIIAQIIADTPLTKLVKEKMTPRKGRRAWEIVLLVLGSPMWLSLLIAAFAVFFSLYVVLWSAIVSLWAVFASLVVCVFVTIATGIGFICGDNCFMGIVMIGAGIVCAGLSIFLLYGCKSVTKGLVWLTKKLSLWVKTCLIKKEET